MNPLMHLMFHYLRRFRWEIALFWVVSGGLSWAALDAGDESVTGRIAPVEVLLLGLVIVRLVLAEAAFRTTGGWELRPVGGKMLFHARLCALAFAIVPPMVVRGIVWQDLTRPDAGMWLDMIWNDALPVLAFTAGLLLLARLARLFLARELAGLVLVVVGPLLLIVAFVWLSGTLGNRGRSFHVTGRAYFPEALMEAMPAGANYLGKNNSYAGHFSRVTREGVREIGRMALEKGELEMGERVAVIDGIGTAGDRLELSMRFRSPRSVPSTSELIFVVKYADGSYSAGGESTGRAGDVRFWMFGMRAETRRAIYESPRSLPWNRRSWAELLKGAELIVFERVTEKVDPLERSREGGGRRLLLLELAYLHAQRSKVPGQVRSSMEIGGATDVPQLLSWPTWSDTAWERMVRPFLERHATDEHRELLEKRFSEDPRLAEVLWKLGWKEKVMPELRRRLDERFPLESGEFGMLAEEKDPALAKELAEALVAADGDWPELYPKLQGYPGIDAKALIISAWRKLEVGSEREEKKDPFAIWAADEGDVSAVRYLARRQEGKWVGRHVDAGAQDPVAWLAKHGETMRFDPERKLFVASGEE